MKKGKEKRIEAAPRSSEKGLMAASEAAHPLSADASGSEEIDGVISIFEEMDIEPVDVMDDESTLGIDLPKRGPSDMCAAPPHHTARRSLGFTGRRVE